MFPPEVLTDSKGLMHNPRLSPSEILIHKVVWSMVGYVLEK